MIRRTTGVAALTAVALSAASATAQQPNPAPAGPPADPAAAAAWLEKAYGDKTPPEAVRMLIAIARGSQMGPNDGWFGPCQTRYTWQWLAKAHGVDPAKGISRSKFRGKPEWFARLDRNKDGVIGADDLDWSDESQYVQMAYMVNRVFRRLDGSGDGKVTRAEWDKFFEKAAGGKDHLTGEDLRDALLAGVGGGGGFRPGDGPNPATLVRGLFAGEIGSLNEGPKVGQPAPDFTLKTHDGRQTVRLSELTGSKPVVLVFGNFTCGPFRSLYPGVEQVYRRFKDEANFVGVYVREAHPTDGWAMMSNTMSGVAVKQPKTYAERAAVAGQFCEKLHPSFPFLVDEINDPVGNAYSGMPARLYVIDPSGKVAYKSGRGPFGFKTGEMEQALAMALLEAAGDRPTGGQTGDR